MSYQYNHSTTYQSYTEASLQLGIQSDNRYNKTVGNSTDAQKNSALSLGAVGDILTGTVLQGGDSPIVEMNGTPIKVRSDALKQTQKGEQIYLQITKSSSSEITMKIVDQKSISTATRNGAMQTEIMKNTAQFVENWKQYQEEHTPNSEAMKDDADYVLQSMTSEEKAKLRQMGIDVSSSNLTMVKSLLAQMRGKEQDADLQRAIEDIRQEILMANPQKAPEEFQITIQEETLQISDVTKEANAFLPITEEQFVYLIQNNLPLNLDNLYKAEYSAKPMPAKAGISQNAFQQMQPQIERSIQTAGMEVNDDTLNTARFLLDHQLPVNTDSLRMMTAIQDVNENGFSSSQILENITDATADAVSDNRLPNKQETTETFTFTFEYYRRTELYFSAPSVTANQIMADLNQITDQGFRAFSETGLPYTLEQLSAFCQAYQPAAMQASGEGLFDPSAFQSEHRLETAEFTALTAHRQLEEIRLKMTWEASYTLATEDIHIRARELTEVVDALRNQERNYFAKQYQAQGIEPTSDMMRLTQDTNRKMQELPYLPASALSATLFSGSFTLERLHAQGTTAISEMHTSISYTQVSSYETLMTRPRGDMGDSIQKAFRNVDDILEDMQIPATEDNQRAVRILGYNQMEITTENLAQVKAADQQVQSLIRNLQPSMVLNLVRDGINPLNMPIEELNDLIQNYIHEDGITDEGKYSEFLQKLDRKNGITPEERQSYIGIYRLLDKVTKSKGKDIGTLVRNGQEITLQNLLTAHRSNRATGMNTTIDETFGGLEVNSVGTSITSQIEEAFAPDASNSETNYAEANNAIPSDTEATPVESATIQYNQQLTQQLFNRLTPDLIAEMTQQVATGITLEEFFDTIQDQLVDDFNNEAPENSGDDKVAEQEIDEALMQSLDGLPEDTGTFMNTMNIFPSLTNMMMSADILRRGNRTFRDTARLGKQVPNPSQAPANEQSENRIDNQLEQLAEHLNSAEEMEQAYADLEANITETVHQADTTGAITAMDIQALKQVRSGLRIMQKMSRKEQFEIPFSVNGQWNVMHLSIVQNAEVTGLLQADVPTESGTLSASISWKESHWEGNFSSDTQEGTVLLERNQATISEALAAMSSIEEDTPTTNEMYRMAKQLVVLMKHITTA